MLCVFIFLIIQNSKVICEIVSYFVIQVSAFYTMSSDFTHFQIMYIAIHKIFYIFSCVPICYYYVLFVYVFYFNYCTIIGCYYISMYTCVCRYIYILSFTYYHFSRNFLSYFRNYFPQLKIQMFLRLQSELFRFKVRSILEYFVSVIS